MIGPKIDFSFPIRWLKKENRKHLKKNLEIQINKQRGVAYSVTHPRLVPPSPVSYSVLLKVHAYQPVNVSLKKEELEEMLSGVMFGARITSFEKFFVQKNSYTSLPVIEIQIFY